MRKIIKCFRYSISYFAGYKRYLVIVCTLQLLRLICTLLSPLAYGRFISAITNKAKLEAIVVLSVIVLLQLFTLLITNIIGRIENKIKNKICNNVQNSIFHKILNIPPFRMNTLNEGYIFGLITRDCLIPASFVFTIISGIYNAIIVVGVGIIVFFLNPVLFVVMLLTYPLIYLINNIYSKKLKENQKQLLNASDEFIGYTKNILSNLTFVKENDGNDCVESTFKNKNLKQNKRSINLGIVQLNYGTILGLLGIINYFLVNIIGIILVVLDKIIFGDFVSFNGYSNNFTTSLTALVTLNSSLQPAYVQLDRLRDIEELFSKSCDLEKQLNSLDITNCDIKVHNITFSLFGNDILENVSFYAKQGEFLHLIGKNGSGKTTILKLLMKEYTQNSGDIYIGNINLKLVRYTDITKYISYLDQKSPILPLTIYENIVLFDHLNNISREEIIEICKKVDLWADIDKLPLGLDTVISERFSLSAGQIQKVQVIRCILKNTPIILMDEITSNMDSSTSKIVLNLVKEMKEKGKTIIFVSHRTNDELYADNTFYLNSN